MNTFEIKISVKRPRKIYKLMDYLIMLGIIAIAAVLIVFLPYSKKKNELAASEVAKITATSRMTQLERNKQEIQANSSVAIQYEANHSIIEKSIYPVHEYLQSLNDFAAQYAEGRYSITSQTVTGNVISLSVLDEGLTCQVIEFKEALLDNKVYTYNNELGLKKSIDLSWISNIVMGNTVSNNSITLEVYYGE